MSESRTRHYHKGRLPREKRTISVFGAVSYIDGREVKDQSDKLYRCWNCGFLCNTDRDKLGDGVGYTIKDLVEDNPYNMGASSFVWPDSNAGELDMRITMDTVSTPVLMQLDSEGNPVTVMHNLSQIVHSGCPLCGTMNYK